MDCPPSEVPPHLLAGQQARFNRSTREHWSHFASHRERIEQLLVADGIAGGGRLCVLGAGNCNDLDLPRLAETFDAVHLVDLDPGALRGAIERQGVAASPKISTHAPVDLTGIADTLSRWPMHPPTPAEVASAIEHAGACAIASVAGPFDVVLSPCVLSQLAGYAGDTLGRSHPRSRALRRAIRDRHLRLMIDLLTPGGFGVLITDVVSSLGQPSILERRYDDLPSLLQKLTHRGETYPALDPASVEQFLRHDPRVAATLSDVQFIRPWVWTLGPMKSFLVYAMRFRKTRAVVLDAVQPRAKIWTP